MSETTTASELSKLIKELRSERKEHVDAIARIDQTFTQFGISPEGKSIPSSAPAASTVANTAAKKATPKNGRKKSGRKKGGRSNYAMTGEETILDFVANNDKPTTKDVNGRWHGEGRGGKADNTISKLVKEGKLKRIKLKNERGSRYKLG